MSEMHMMVTANGNDDDEGGNDDCKEKRNANACCVNVENRIPDLLKAQVQVQA
jgi:hypothetical protein